jgi:hypothetical protein
VNSDSTTVTIDTDKTVTANFNLIGPAMEPLDEPEGQYHNAAPAFANFGFDDDEDLDDGWYQIDSYEGDWIELFTDVSGTSWDNDGWEIPDFDALAEGSHTIYFKASDDDGNTGGESGEWSWQFYKDTIPPPDPADVTSPSHTTGEPSSDNTIDITWTDPEDPGSGIDGYSILWDHNPETIPDSTRDIEEGTGSNTSDPLYDGDWYFHLRTVDNAGNWTSTVHLGPFITMTLPGDANSDGEINVLDMTKVARIILLMDPETPGADANQDGVVNVLDMTKIARMILLLDP